MGSLVGPDTWPGTEHCHVSGGHDEVWRDVVDGDPVLVV